MSVCSISDYLWRNFPKKAFNSMSFWQDPEYKKLMLIFFVYSRATAV